MKTSIPRIRNVRLKKGGALLHILPPPRYPSHDVIVNTGSGRVVITSTDKEITFERAIFLLEDTKQYLLANWDE
jgi:hypothetical protein